MTVGSAPLRLGEAEIELVPLSDADPLLASPQFLSAWLAEEERRTLLGLATTKRKRDWLAARLAAKRLIGKRLKSMGQEVSPNEIQVLATPDREPYIGLMGKSAAADFPISISHAGDWGACALAAKGTRVGFDLERIEPRHPGWVSVMADETELDAGMKASPEMLTSLWTAKEAVLKLLGLGLSVDMRSVRPRSDGTVELLGRSLERWAKLGRPRITLFHGRHSDCGMTAAIGR